MKKLLFTLAVLITPLLFAQKSQALQKFQAVYSDIGATIHIVKSDTYKAEITGNSDLTEYVSLTIDDSTLKIRSKKTNIDYSDVLITVYMPSLNVLAMSNGGVLTMEKDFSRVPSLVVSAEDKALVDLSNIEFSTLITSSDKGSKVLYKSAQTIVQTSANWTGVNISN